MRFLRASGTPPPKILYAATELVLKTGLGHALAEDEPNRESVKAMLDEARLQGITLDGDTLGYVFRLSLERLAEWLLAEPHEYLLFK